MNQLEGDNTLKPVTVKDTERYTFERSNVCSICRQHPQAKPTADRGIYEIHCLNCGFPIIKGGYISVYELEQLEMIEWETKTEVRKTDPNFDENEALKGLGF